MLFSIFPIHVFIIIIIIMSASQRPCQNFKLRTDHLIFRGGGWEFFEKIVCFPTGAKKLNVFNEVKSKKFVLHSLHLFEAIFPRSCKGLQITQKLSCLKHADLILASIVLNVNYKIRKIVRPRNICNYYRPLTCSIDS